MNRGIALVYGIVAYCVFLPTFLYAVAFVGSFAVPRTIDGGGPRSTTWMALLIDVALLGLFAVQHSVMARRSFKRWWTTVVPPVIERSTYVLISSLLLILLFWQWRPIPDVVWSVENDAMRVVLWTLFACGWAIVLVSTFLIDHFELFGVKQVIAHWRAIELKPPEFRTIGLYRWVRHPLMLGFLIAFWATPNMTVGHLLFAVATTGYILIALQIEERDLVHVHGEDYREYRRQVSMLLPVPKTRRKQASRA